MPCETAQLAQRSGYPTDLHHVQRWGGTRDAGTPKKKDEHGIEEIHGNFTLQFPGRLCWWLYNVIECYTMLYIIAILGI